MEYPMELCHTQVEEELIPQLADPLFLIDKSLPVCLACISEIYYSPLELVHSQNKIQAHGG